MANSSYHVAKLHSSYTVVISKVKEVMEVVQRNMPKYTLVELEINTAIMENNKKVKHTPNT